MLWPHRSDSDGTCYQVGELLLGRHERGAQLPRLIGDGRDVALHALHVGVVRHMKVGEASVEGDVVIVYI